MDSETLTWVIVAIALGLVLIAVAVALMKRASARKEEHHRERAGELREQAAATDTGIRRHQAEADEADARARGMRADADRKMAEAKRLEADARDKKGTLHDHVERRDEVLSEADRIDPDVDADARQRGEAANEHTTGQHRG